MNKQMNPAETQQMLKQFAKEQMKAEMNQDMISGAMDMGYGDVDEEADALYD
eukprot:CAMPEP_0202958336 /NCGR_PEP_ID=MMETSP1396-20130829/2699_1 /ASSEMBLY_ACC=CAM_ASM_000872 /TAXON_ID= /ORGANISM="Pseudokeronopsis sp., Strain Brazil" /LENGTH=51 /DNA_ID=CAMNT_0049676367 /DNA_START=302 /DNA_END=457 /DNA_ORIENTATION=+